MTTSQPPIEYKPNTKVEFLDKSLKDDINQLHKLKRRNEILAFGLKFISTLLAVSITVLLGLRVGDQWQVIFTNVALIFGAVISVASAVDAFFNPRAFWIQQGAALSRMRIIKADLDYLAASRDDEKIDRLIEGLYNQYRQAVLATEEGWLNIRKESGDQPAKGSVDQRHSANE
jgi:hypothetical protein